MEDTDRSVFYRSESLGKGLELSPKFEPLAFWLGLWISTETNPLRQQLDVEMDSNDNTERTVEESIALLSKWFTTVCKFVPLLANQLSSELVHEAGITEVEQFSMVQQIDPNWLDSLKCQMPTLVKMLVKANVEKIGRTPLRHLDLEDVRGVVDACLPEFPYGAIFKEKKISGFTLSCVETVDALVEFGVTNTIHAAPLFASINEWKRIGVPNELIAENTLRNVHIKEEVFREMNRSGNSSQNALATSSTAEAFEQANTNTTANNSNSSTTPASIKAKKTHTPQRTEPSYVGMGTSSNPVCFSSSASEAGSDEEDEEEMEMEVEVEVEDEKSVHSTHSMHSNHSSHTACTAHSAAPPTPMATQSAQQHAVTKSDQNIVDHSAGRTDDFAASGGAENTDDDNDENLASVSTFDPIADHNLDHVVADTPVKAASGGAQAQDINDQSPNHDNTNLLSSQQSKCQDTKTSDHHQGHEEHDNQEQDQCQSRNRSQEQVMDLTPTNEEQDLTSEQAETHTTGHKRTHSTDSANAATSNTSNTSSTTNYGAEADQTPSSKRAKRTKTPSPRFPGIPHSPDHRIQYAAIFEAIEATRPGKVIRLSKEHVQLLLDTPRSLIQGHWEFQDMSFQPSHHGYLSSGQRRQNQLRGKALVFVPTSLRRADAMVSPGRELIFVESSKKRSKVEWRRAGQETAAASSEDSSNEEDGPLDEGHLYGCRVRPGAHIALPPKGMSHAQVTQLLPEPEIEDFIYTRPFPGIPHYNGASPRRYAGIIDAIEASRAGKVIRVSRADIQTLLLTPAEEVGGHWEFQNRWPLPEDCELSITLKRQSVMLKHALVFVPDTSSNKQTNVISMRGAPPRELVFVESTKRPSERNSRREDQSATSGDSEPEVEGARRQYGTVLAAPEGPERQNKQSQQTQVITHSDVALSSAVYGGRVSMTATGDRRENYAEHFNYGPYPGIPLHEELQQQYRPIVEKIEATRVGDDVFCTEEEVAMLLTLPEEFIGGIWVRADRSQVRDSSARIAASESAANALRANTVVFFPSAAPQPGSLEDTRIVIVELKNSAASFQPSPALHVLKQAAESSASAQSTTTKAAAKRASGTKATHSAVSSSSQSNSSSTEPALEKPVTYGELYGDQPFPGIPQHPLLQAQYDDIVDRIRRTQVGEAVLVTENQRDMLRAMPSPLVNGRWVQQDTSYHLGRASNDTKDNERRAKSLVFIPSSGAVPAEVPLEERMNPATADNIVIVTSAPKKVKTKSIEVVEPVKKKAPAKAAAKTVIKAAPAAKAAPKAAPKAAAAKSGAKAAAVKAVSASKPPTVYSVHSDSDSEDSDNGATGRTQTSAHPVKREVSSDEDNADQSGARPRRKSAAAALRTTVTSASKAPRRHSSAHETQSVGARSVSSSNGGVLAFHEAVRRACHDVNHSRDDKAISDAVKYLGDAAAKSTYPDYCYCFYNFVYFFAIFFRRSLRGGSYAEHRHVPPPDVLRQHRSKAEP